ncbi:MAG: heavy metal translocating P-type ATPase [Planctomycetota bacterium]|jgi:Cd2+/Zn2+-exporting ATPase
MIGRYAESSGFGEVLKSGDLIRVVLSVPLIITGVILRHILEAPPGWIIAFPLTGLALTGFPIVWGAVKGLVRWKVNVDELVSIAIIASLILGEFDGAAVVAFIMALGGLIEEFTSDRARKAVEAVLRERPAHAILVSEGDEREVPIEQVCSGDRVRVRPGDVIPLDGELVHGFSSVDESAITGEALPVSKECGEKVFAGSQNFEGCIDLEVTCPSCDSVMARIAKLIEEAEDHRAPILRVAHRYAQWFTPAILLLAGATWLLTGEPLRAVTVLIVGCPCAFVLATPTAVVAALGRAARQGVLVKGGKFLEAAGEVNLAAFDKTGTLTEGIPEVSSIWSMNGVGEGAILEAAAEAESGSEHPLGRAVVAEACARGIEVPTPPQDMEAVRGMGVRSGSLRVGSPRFMEKEGVNVGPEAAKYLGSDEAGSMIRLLVARDRRVIGGITLKDKLREEAPEVVAWMKGNGLDTVLLTGDREAPASAVGNSVGITDVRPSLLPEEKQAFIRELQGEGKRVVYVGDGTNDGPALAEAHVGVSLASRRNTVALETADAVFMEQGIRNLPFLLRLGRRTRSTINQNLVLFGLIFNGHGSAHTHPGCVGPQRRLRHGRDAFGPTPPRPTGLRPQTLFMVRARTRGAEPGPSHEIRPRKMAQNRRTKERTAPTPSS